MVAVSGQGSASLIQSNPNTQAGSMMMGAGAISLMSGFASLQAASMQARQYKIQGIFQGLALSQEKLRGREQATFIRKKFLDNLSSTNASFAHRQVSTGSGIGRQFAIQSLRKAQEGAKAAELNSQAAQIQLRLDASQTRLAEKTARNMGIMRAGQQFGLGAGNLVTGYKTIKNG